MTTMMMMMMMSNELKQILGQVEKNDYSELKTFYAHTLIFNIYFPCGRWTRPGSPSSVLFLTSMR